MEESSDPLKRAIAKAYRMDEALCIKSLLNSIQFSKEEVERIQVRARDLMERVRSARLKEKGFSAFLQTYDLSSQEGIALMCIAEALLRIPDNDTQDRFIKDKILSGNWAEQLGKSHSFLVNAATRGLVLLEKLFDTNMSVVASNGMSRLVIVEGMKRLGNHFVIADTITNALEKASSTEKLGYRYSYDMLGEAAKTARDAADYLIAYETAIDAIGKAARNLGPIQSPGISIKLSALYPRYEWNKRERVLAELFPILKKLVLQAKTANIGLTIDAEEADRLDLSLLLIEKLVQDQELLSWQGLGLAVQSYQKRANFVIDWLIDLARKNKRRLMIRLVKGAYWDSEIKWSQEKGLSSYPVFTRKSSTDVSYLACAKKILTATDLLYPQFATHNAHTVAAILEMAGDRKDFEFQCLQGMGRSLYDNIVGVEKLNIPCRIYAPVGKQEHLLAYLVRRLLENGSSSSFVNLITHQDTPIEALIRDPISIVSELKEIPNPKIPLPIDLFGSERPNAKGLDLSSSTETDPLLVDIQGFLPRVLNHAIQPISAEEIEEILAVAQKAAPLWDRKPIDERASCLEKMAGLLEKNKPELMAFLIREGGKTVQDSLSELREAIDYCWYYSVRSKEDFKEKVLTGVTGEQNLLSLHGRGVIACISPWNFPLAIFLGQVTAALVAGNAVIAKPSSQTPLIAARVISLLHEAGVPKEVVQLMVGSGSVIGDRLMQDKRIQGVLLTGSTSTAWQLNQQLAARRSAIVPLIAETGGQNVMIVDSSALAEEVVTDVITSAFNSAGQRCSALRVLFLQTDVAPRIISMLQGAMAELKIGDPFDLSTDIGPVIDEKAASSLQAHVERMKQEAKLVYECRLPDNLPQLPRGVFFAPRVYEIQDITVLTEEVFGPILHIVQYKASDLDKVIKAVNETGFGLTLGIHSRITSTMDYIRSRVRVGNIYVNRNMIGAVVGVQPFGGEGLSGTGPKAGGPHMLARLSVERSLSINTTVAGGNASLMSLKEE